MAINQDELDSFHHFASEELKNGSSDLSWQDVFHLWQVQHPTKQEQAEIYEALDESLEDIHAGRTKPADEAMRELRAKYNIPE